MNNQEVINWLMESDPSIRWQVMKDLLHTDGTDIEKERRKVEDEGWGHKILLRQDPDSKWSGQLYNKKWVSTTYALLMLKEYGLIPNQKVINACEQLFINGIYNNEEIRFSSHQKYRDNGVTGLVLGLLCYFKYEDNRIHDIAEFLISQQKTDGSWFYDEKPGAEKYRYENTLIILKGLLEYIRFSEINHGIIKESQQKAHEFLLSHKLIKENDKECFQFSFPYYWFYDILVALDYFRNIDIKDSRLSEAIDILVKKQNSDGTWNLQNKHSGLTFFDMEEVGKPSRWNTLRALRVLNWWRDYNFA